MNKVLIDRELLEDLIEQYIAEMGYTNSTAHHAQKAMEAPSGTPAMPVKAYYHEAPNEYGGLNKSVGLEVRKEFADAPLVLGADALARIACLEGEIAKRDETIARLETQLNRAIQANYDLREELAACRVAVENCDVFRARIAELEARYQRDVCGLNNEGDPIGGDPAGGYANDNARLRSELAAIKAQGVVQWPEADEIMQMAFEEGQPADDASGYYFELEEFDLFIERLISEVASLNAATVQHPKCKTCDDNGRIGGPSFCAPDEGGEPCPDCCSPVQQVSVPDGKVCVPVEVLRLYEFMAASFTPFTSQHEQIAISLRKAKAAMLAAPAAPAADAWMVAVEWAKDAEEWGPALNEAGWLFLSELNEDPQKSALIFNSTKGPLRAAIMKYAEIVTAHCAKGAV